MASTPIAPGSIIALRNSDDNDPATPVEAWFIQDGEEACLGNSFGADTVGHFVQLLSVFCTFHGLPRPVNETRYTDGELQ